MKTTYTSKLKSFAMMAGGALVPTAAVFISSVVLSGGFISNATALTATSDLSLTVAVPAVCTFGLGSYTLDFGSYDPVSANNTAAKQATTSFSVTCTLGASVTFQLGDGLNVVTGQRKLKLDASNLLNYNLYSDTGYSVAWNATTFPPAVVAGGLLTPISKTIYGSIPGGQDVKAGTYTDTVVITATF